MSNVRTKLTELLPEEIEHFLGEVPRLLLRGLQSTKLCRLLMDFDFIEAKINHPQFGIKSLIDDFNLIKNLIEISEMKKDLINLDSSYLEIDKIKTLNLIHDTLRISAHILTIDKTQIATQLYGRLKGYKNTEIQALLADIKNKQTTPWLRPLTDSLTPPGQQLLYTLIAHKDLVSAITITPNGKRVISGSYDNTIQYCSVKENGE
jgi:WD40 repeat protein